MNLDSLSLALSEISYSVANLTKKNFKSSVAEINNLVTRHGAEAERHLFRCLFSYVDFSGDGKSSGKDFHQTQLLIQEFGSLISKVNFVSILCYAIDCPLHLQKSLKPSSQLFTQISKVLKLSRVQDVICGIALLSSSNPDIRNYAAQFIKQKLPDLIRSYVDADTTVNQEGGLQDVAIEVIHLLLAHLVKGKDQFGIGADQKEAFLQTLRKDFPRDRVPVVLRPLLYPDIDDVSIDKLPDSSGCHRSIMESSLADMILEAGYGCTATVEECRNTLMQFGVRELKPAAVARVLGMMARSHQGLNENVSLQSLNSSSLGGGGSIWGDTKDKPENAGVNTWNVEVFVQVIQDLAPHLNWREVVSELDHPEFYLENKRALSIIVRGLIKGLVEVFPVDLIYRQWKNSEGQLSFIVQSIRNPDVFCLADYPCHTVVIDILKTPPDDDKREIATWKSLDLVEALLRLSEQHNQQVSELFTYPVRNCPDMLVLALLQISPTWNTLKQELISMLMPIFLGNHPNSAIVLHYAWHCPGLSSTIRTLIMHSMAEWYMRGEPHDQTRLGRILDVAQDLKALSMLLNASPFAFVIDLACLASRREYLKLDKWLSDKIRDHGEPFIQACATFLKRRCPQLVGGMVKDDPSPQSKSQQLPMETIATMVCCLHQCANSGQVQMELADAIRTMVNNANQILNKVRPAPPGTVGPPKPMNPVLPQALPLPPAPVAEVKPPDPMLQQWSTWQPDKKKLDGPGILGPVGLGASSSVSSSFPQGLMTLNPGPPSPPKAFPGLPSQTGHVFNAMHSITTQLQSLGMQSTLPTSMPSGMQGPRSTVTSLGALSVQTALKNPANTPSGRPRKTGNGGDMSNFFPEMNQTFSKEVEDEANSYFQRIYNHPPHPTMSTDEVLDMLKRFKDSANKKERDVYFCMLRSLLEEYRFFPNYPEKELHTTAVLFGGIIEQGLVTYMALGIALRYVLEALRKPSGSLMYFFGIAALDRFKSRLKDYPQYCTHLASIPHFNQFPQHLIEYVEYGARSQEPPHHPQGAITTRSLTPSASSMTPALSGLGMPPLTPTPTSAGTPMEGLNTGTATPTSAATSTPAEATSASPAAPSKTMPKPSIANATNIDTLLAGQGKEEISVPPESVQDKVFFIFNNLSLANMSQKSEELKEFITEEFMPWVSQYLVMKRASIEPNFHTLYANFIDALGMPNISTNVTKETFRNIKVLLRSDKGVANFSDRALLKNLGHWLGMLTLAKNKPILQIDIDLKALLYEAYHKGAQELLYVVPFTAKVIESCAKSKVFKPPNPWTMGIMNVLSELHQEQNLKLNLKFEIEVLCKTLGIDINELKPGNYLHDPHRLAVLEPQLSGSTKILSPQPDLDPVVAVSTPPAVPVTVGGSASTSTPSVSLPPQPQFAFNDINTSSLAGLAPHIIISDHPLWQANPQMKQSVRAAVERSVQELLPPVVERAIKIALNTCEQIVKKDFALDPEENRMRAAAHHMVRNMTAGLALITCREPLCTCINNNLKTTFTSALRGLTQQQKDLIEQAAQMLGQENVELACAFIQKTAVERAIPEMDKRLATEFDLRKHARNEGRRYCDPVVLTYQAERMPEQIRLKVGGVTPQQITVYEEFARNIPGFLPTVTDTSLPSGIARPMPVRDQQSFATDEITQIYEKIATDIKQHLQMVALPPGNAHFVQLHSLMEAVLLARNSREIVTALALLQKAVEGLLDHFTGMASENELMLRFRDCHLLVLRGLQDARAYSAQWTNKQVTRCLIDSRDERKYNVDAVDCLIRAHFVNMQQYDLHLASFMDNGLNYMAVAFAMQLVQRFLVDDKHNTQITEADFYNTIEALGRIASHSRQAPEGLTALIDSIRQSNDGGLLDRTSTQGGPTVMMQSGISQAREFDDPPGLHEKTEYLLREWVTMYHSPAAGRDSTKAFSAFVQQMHQQGILKTDDLITRFFRLCTEMCVDLCYRALGEQSQSQSPTLVRTKCFHTLDAFVRLIALLVKYSGDNTNTVTKINLLNKVLGIVAGVLYQDHEVRQNEFQQLPYHRIFIMLFIELNAPEPILDTINLQVLTAFSNTFHILRPAKAPGFAYAWLELVSHRVFIGRLLALTIQQRGWGMYAQLLIDLFKFLSPFLRNADLTKSTQLLYKGTLRVLLVLLHDFPEFLCDFHYAFCDVIPPNCIQMRNLILSAFPRNMRLPDPFTPNLKVDMLADIAQPPRILTSFVNMIQPAAFRKNLDSYLKTRSPVTFLSELRSNLQSDEPGMRYNIPLINALVLYVGTQAITYINSKGLTPSMSTIAHSSHMDIFQNMGVSLDTEGRYLFLNAIANQLRYPNSHTHYFSCTLLYLFAEANTEAIQEQITRVLLERLIVNRPHPWGLLITFIELIKNPLFKFWNHDFVHCAPEIEKLFDSVARSCMQQKPAPNVREPETGEIH